MRVRAEPSCKSIKLKTNQNENEQLTVKCFTLYCCNALTCGCCCCCGVLIFFSSSHAEHVASGQLFLKKHWTNESLRFSFTELECGANYLWWNRAIATIPLSRRRKRRRGRRYCGRTCYVSKRVDDKKTALYVAIDWIFSLFYYSTDAAAAAARCPIPNERNIVWHSYNLLAIVLCANILSEMFEPHRFQFGGEFFTSRCHSRLYTLQRTRGSYYLLFAMWREHSFSIALCVCAKVHLLLACYG